MKRDNESYFGWWDRINKESRQESEELRQALQN